MIKTFDAISIVAFWWTTQMGDVQKEQLFYVQWKTGLQCVFLFCKDYEQLFPPKKSIDPTKKPFGGQSPILPIQRTTTFPHDQNDKNFHRNEGKKMGWQKETNKHSKVLDLDLCCRLLGPIWNFFFFAFLNMETKTFKETNPNQTKIFVLFHKIEDSKIS